MLCNNEYSNTDVPRAYINKEEIPSVFNFNKTLVIRYHARPCKQVLKYPFLAAYNPYQVTGTLYNVNILSTLFIVNTCLKK